VVLPQQVLPLPHLVFAVAACSLAIFGADMRRSRLVEPHLEQEGDSRSSEVRINTSLFSPQSLHLKS